MERSSLQHLQQPKLRDAVLVTWKRQSVRLQHGTQDCEIAAPKGDDREALRALLGRLREGGRSLPELTRASGLPEAEVIDLLTQLDDLRLLSDTTFAISNAHVSGHQLLRSLEDMESQVLQSRGESELVRALRNGSVGRNQLIGFALEYFWLVRAAPALIAPALSHAVSFAEREVLIDFFRSELHHDRFLARSLAAIGVDSGRLESLQPLPRTFAMAASLAVYAKQHLNSFRAVLRLFERPQPQFEQLIVEQAQALGMPEDFYVPMLQHSRLNAEAAHDDITSTLLGFVPVISPEECAIVLRHYHVMLETQFHLENEILHHYAGDELRLRTTA